MQNRADARSKQGERRRTSNCGSELGRIDQRGRGEGTARARCFTEVTRGKTLLGWEGCKNFNVKVPLFPACSPGKRDEEGLEIKGEKQLFPPDLSNSPDRETKENQSPW